MLRCVIVLKTYNLVGTINIIQKILVFLSIVWNLSKTGCSLFVLSSIFNLFLKLLSISIILFYELNVLFIYFSKKIIIFFNILLFYFSPSPFPCFSESVSFSRSLWSIRSWKQSAVLANTPGSSSDHWDIRYHGRLESPHFGCSFK